MAAEAYPPTQPDLSDAAVARRLTLFYHAGCPDGTCAAWAIYTALPAETRQAVAQAGGIGSDGAWLVRPLVQLRAGGPVFAPLAPGAPAPAAALIEGRHVVYADVCPEAAVLGWVAARAATLLVLDHHRSSRPALEALGLLPAAAAEWPPLPRAADAGAAGAAGGAGPCALGPALAAAVRPGGAWGAGPPPALGAGPPAPARARALYSEAAAACELAWAWARPGAPPPEFVRYVSDADRAAWRLSGSRAVHKAMAVEGLARGFGPLDALARAGGGLPAGLAARGELYRAGEAHLLRRLAAAARPATLWSRLPGDAAPRAYRVLAVNAPVLQSELGEALMRGADPSVAFAVVWAYAPDRSEVRLSARTTRAGVDLSVIMAGVVGARRGGGHPQAAACTVAAGADGVGRIFRQP